MTPNPVPPSVVSPPPAPPTPKPKPGFLTSEFWLHIIGVGAAIAVLTFLLGILQSVAAQPNANPIVGTALSLVCMGIIYVIKLLVTDYLAHRTDLKMSWLPDIKAPAVLLLVCASLLFSSSCATMSSAEKSQLLDCGEKSLAGAATSLAPQVGSIISGQSPNWNADLGDLLVVAGEAGVCAVEVVISQLEQGHTVTADIGGAGAGPAAAAVVPIPVALMRAYSFKMKAGYRVKR